MSGESSAETGSGTHDDADPDSESAEIVEETSGTGIPVRGNDIDTDQIIPARYLKAITFDGLGEYVFYDQRFRDGIAPEAQREGDGDSEARSASGRASGQSPRAEAVEREATDHPFNDDRFEEASVLVVNANFGCGSSREHAPQALARWGIDAVVGESFAEIFAGNCLALGIPTVTAPGQDVRQLQDHVEEYPDTLITIDVAAGTVAYGERTVEGSVDDAQRTALVEGVWDTTALLKSNREAIHGTARSLPYVEPAKIGNAPGAPSEDGDGSEGNATTDAAGED